MEGFEAMGLALYKDKGVVFSCFLPKKRAVGLLAARILGAKSIMFAQTLETSKHHLHLTHHIM